MELVHPLFLLLLPLPGLWLWRALNSGSEASTAQWLLRHPHLPAAVSQARGGNRLPQWLTALALCLMVMALAQPRETGKWLMPPPEGRDIALVIDTSLTMSIDDFVLGGKKVERMAVLKQVLGRFIRDRSSDRFSIIAFGSSAATLTPPTFDHALAIAQLDRLQVGMAGPDTALGDALGLALKHVQSGNLRPVVILVSDGGDSNTGNITPSEAVAVAREMKVAVHAVQIGSDLFAAGRPANADANKQEAEPGLAEIARLTGGQYWFVRDTQAAQQMVRDIDRLEKTLARPAQQREVYEWYWLPLLLAAICLLLARVIEVRRQA